jgi:hypothetical protein
MGSKIEFGGHTTKREQTMRQIREMMSVAEALISTNPKEAQAHYAKMEPLWTRLWAERGEDTEAKQEKSRADWAKIDANREKRKVDMKAFNEMMERRLKEKPTRRRGRPSGKLKKKEGRLKEKPTRRMAERKAEEERREAERKAYEQDGRAKS